jgi:hypothetical protein
MSEAVLDSRVLERKAASATSVLRSGWTALRLQVARWLARQRLGRSIAHLDNRLLADAGFNPRDLGLGERLIRRHVAGGDIWRLDRSGW